MKNVLKYIKYDFTLGVIYLQYSRFNILKLTVWIEEDRLHIPSSSNSDYLKLILI